MVDFSDLCLYLKCFVALAQVSNSFRGGLCVFAHSLYLIDELRNSSHLVVQGLIERKKQKPPDTPWNELKYFIGLSINLNLNEHEVNNGLTTQIYRQERFLSLLYSTSYGFLACAPYNPVKVPWPPSLLWQIELSLFMFLKLWSLRGKQQNVNPSIFFTIKGFVCRRFCRCSDFLPHVLFPLFFP